MVESVIQIKSGITINCVWNPSTYSCKNGKYLAIIIDDSMIKCDETIEETKTATKNFNEKISMFYFHLN